MCALTACRSAYPLIRLFHLITGTGCILSTNTSGSPLGCTVKEGLCSGAFMYSIWIRIKPFHPERHLMPIAKKIFNEERQRAFLNPNTRLTGAHGYATPPLVTFMVRRHSRRN